MRALAYLAGTIIVLAVSVCLLVSRRSAQDAAREAELDDWANSSH